MFGPAVVSQPFAVQRTAELRRVVALPRRVWDDGEAASTAAQMSSALRTAAGSMALRPIQATALLEAGMLNGGFFPIRVGGGKTLLSLLTPTVMDARRPLLLLPAKLIAKTEREMRALMLHWQIPNFVRIVSYEMLGRVQSAELLERYQPDLIVCDEAHRLKNPRAAVTKRVLRYLAEHEGCRFVAMSGTVTKRSIRDFAHLLKRCLPADAAPIPRTYTEIEEWSDALDEKPRAENRLATGALVLLCDEAEAAIHKTEPLRACRLAFRRRLVETEGVIATTEGHTGASLSITALEPRLGPEVDAAFRKLREDWELPDGSPMADGLARWRHARELALGFYYRWDPAPPREWLARRKAWCSACRDILGSNRRNLDSELQVTRAVAEGLYPQATSTLEAWRAVKDTFRPNTIPVWLDDGAVVAALSWTSGPGIVWTEQQAFADRLASLSGLAYYGKQGVDRRGRPIELADPREPLIASIASNSEGRNLQAWSRNLITSPPPNGSAWEQLLGRTHRDGQEADEVSFDLFVTCREHAAAFEQARADALYIEQATGQSQKLLYADTDVPTADRPDLR